MGALDYLSDFCTVTSTRKSKRKPMQVFIYFYASSLVPSPLIFILSFTLLSKLSPPKRTLEKQRIIIISLKCFLLSQKLGCGFNLLLNFQTVDIKVKMDCDGCERRVKNAVSSMKGSYLNTSISPSLSLSLSFSFRVKCILHF